MKNPIFNSKLLKIGLSKNPIERAKTLSGTSVPDSYVLLQSFEVNDMLKAEKIVFNVLTDSRYSKEFFECPLNDAIDACKYAQKTVNSLKNEVIPLRKFTHRELDLIASRWTGEDLSYKE